MEIEQIKEYQVFTDVGNAYLQALTREKLNIVGGPEFAELQGHVLVMYPEQLTGESIQSFLTFVVQLQWLVALGRLYLHKSLPCPSLW